MANKEFDGILEDSLLRSRELEELDSTLWNDKCDYINMERCNNLNPNNYNLIILQLNIRSLLAHQGDLCQLIRTTEKKNSRIDIILLCETFISKSTFKMVKIPGFTHVGNFCKEKKGGGVSILIHDGIAFRHRQDLDVFEEGLTESIFIKVKSKSGRQIIFGSLYKPPNSCTDQYLKHVTELVHKTRMAQGNHPPELVLGMDHNINLLNGKIHSPTQKFIQGMEELCLYPTITRPTRISRQTATLRQYIRNRLTP